MTVKNRLKTNPDSISLVRALKSDLIQYCQTRDDVQAIADHAFTDESWTKWTNRARDDGYDDVIDWMHWIPTEARGKSIDSQIKQLLDPIFFNADGSARTAAEIAVGIDVFHQQQFQSEHLASRQRLAEVKERFSVRRNT